MKNSLSFLFFVLFLSISLTPSCQSNKVSAPGGKSVFISQDVLKTAKWAEFDYKTKLDQSLRGNVTAMQEFFEFMTYVDDKQRIEHAVTCLEIIPVVGDQVFSTAVQNLKPKFRDVFRAQIQIAMGKTENPEIKGKQITELYPYTWGALNHAPITDQSQKGVIPVDSTQKSGAFDTTAPGLVPPTGKGSPAQNRPENPKPNERTAPESKEKGGKN